MSKRWCIWTLLALCFVIPAHAQEEAVAFSEEGGYYDHSFYLVLSSNNPQHHIHYTLNGQTPDATSPRFEEPLYLDNRLYSSSDIYTIQISPDDLLFLPDSVEHAIVIRAAVFDEHGTCISPVVTHTYLIRDLTQIPENLAVVSICADSLALFDHETGIMVPGANWDPTDPYLTGNYYQKGEEWERPISFEFIEPGQLSSVHQTCGLRTHGNRARRYPNKGLKLYAREKYGERQFSHDFFGKEGHHRFKRLVLKPYSSLWPHAGIQDQLCVEMALRLGIDAPFSRPVRLYINGEYWGLYFLQERIDEHYLEDHYPVNADNCCMIQNWNTTPEFGDARDFDHLMDWLNTHDVQSPKHYSYLCDRIDMDNFINYLILETFVANYDWPANNTRLWKEKQGKWRWIKEGCNIGLAYPQFIVWAANAQPALDWYHSSKASSHLIVSW